ncbi:MAG: PKD domain-containing protein [Methylococcaceae bacterium]
MKLFSLFKTDWACISLILLFAANSSIAATINVPGDQSTIARAVSAAKSGDVIIVAPGTYKQKSKILIDKKLTISSKWYTTGDTKYINQTILDGIDEGNTLFETEYQEGVDVEISGFTIKRFRYPIIINDAAVIQHNFFTNNGTDAISFESTGNGYVGYNIIEDSDDDGIDIDGREGSYVIEFNTIRNSGDDGMEIRLLTGSASNMTYDIHDNIFTGSDEDGIQLIDHSSDDSGRVFHIYNNILANNAMAGLGSMSDGDTIEDYNGANMLERVNFYNNTVINNKVGVTGGYNFIALNNIIANNSKTGVKRLRKNSVIAHSIFYNNGTNIHTDTITGTGNILNKNPGYDPLTYQLLVGSRSIDKGVASFEWKDELVLDRNASDYVGSAPDLGGKELDNGASVENFAPTVSAGTDQLVLEPSNEIILKGVISDDGLPLSSTIASTWNQTSGPDSVTFVDASDVTTSVSFPEHGKYQLRLTGNDSELTASDSMVVRFAKGGNGDSLSIETPGTTFFEAEDYAYLYGTAEEIADVDASDIVAIKAQEGFGEQAFTEYTLTVTDQEVTFYVWVLGKGLDKNSDSVFVSLANSPEVEVTLPSNNSFDWVKMPGSFNRTAGNWPLIVRAGEYGVVWDRLVFTTDPAFVPIVNRRPIVNAGVNQTINLPNTIRLNGSVKDDGQPTAAVSSTWNQISGPGVVTFDDPNLENSTVAFTKAGTYVLELMGNDGLLQSSDRVTIIVNPKVNQQPSVNAGVDQSISFPNAVLLSGTVTDDGLPNGTLTSLWKQLSGPGIVTFINPNTNNTSATFSEEGTYILELVGNDSLLQSSDEVTIRVNSISNIFNSLDTRISSSTDDAEEKIISGSVVINSTDLELVDEGNIVNNQLVGLRFNSLSIPVGATITRAYIQFQADEVDSKAISLNISGENTDNALTFSMLNADISNRTRTQSSVTWSPEPWVTVGEAGSGQQSPDISAVIQEIVDRSGWSSNNALAIIISGNGERTAVSFNGNAAAAPLLHIEYSDGTAVNQPPSASNVVITGDAKVSQQLTGTYTYHDVNADPEGISAYQWLRDGLSINGATSLVYMLTEADQGTLISFEVKPVAISGVSFGAPKQSSDIGRVTKANGVSISTSRVSLKTDDAEEYVSSGIVVGSTDLELVDEGSTLNKHLVGLRFNNLSIPVGATITNAYIQFQAGEVDSKLTSLVIEGENTDNAVTFSFVNGNISNRDRTVSSVAWNPAPWPTIGVAGSEQQTSDISTVVQEIVNRVGWTSGNSLSIIISGSGERTAVAFEGNPAAAPKLFVEYN